MEAAWDVLIDDDDLLDDEWDDEDHTQPQVVVPWDLVVAWEKVQQALYDRIRRLLAEAGHLRGGGKEPGWWTGYSEGRGIRVSYLIDPLDDAPHPAELAALRPTLEAAGLRVKPQPDGQTLLVFEPIGEEVPA